MNKKVYYGVIALAAFALATVAFGAIANNTLQNDWLVVTNINCTGTYLWTYNGTSFNLTNIIQDFYTVPSNEWGLVYGTTGDWFDYQILTGATPVYINVQMHPLNETVAGEKLIPQVYDKDDTHWQLALYYLNGTQYSGADVLVMYYAHIDWNNPDGLTYIEPSGEEPA